MRGRVFALFLLPLTAVLAPASAKEQTTSEADARWRSGRDALTTGRARHARHHLLQAYALEPANMGILGDLLRVDAADDEAVRLWLYRAALAGADSAGRFRPHKTWPRVPRDGLAEAQELLKLRVAVLKAVARAAGKQRGGKGLSVLRYLQALSRDLTLAAPALRDLTRASLAKASAGCRPESARVISALHKGMRQALTDERWAEALAAARILHGLNQQSGQATGGAAGASNQLPAIVSAKQRARKALREKGEKVHTLDELRAVPEHERDAWSRKHATWAHPGVSVSPTNLYRLETTCGLETLLVATEDIEYHHNRLVKWYGRDPFKTRRGLVKLVPTQTDFESAGQPFWWAGGFQSGDVTTVRVSFSSRHGIAGVLTHELTHRFDGTLYPGLPSWLLEGRATHTATCSPDPHGEELDERRVTFRRIWKASTSGYGRRANLEKLLKGTIADYRDNYDAGYSLWVFLRRFQSFGAAQQGDPIFAPKLEAYLESFRKKRGGDPVTRFQAFFVDGKAGRPADMAGFAALFGQFLRGGAAVDPPPWRRTWMKHVRQARRSQRRTPHVSIDDRATWARDRNRADPVEHGEQHAYAAALLLESWKEHASAYAAFEWAFHVDEPVAERSAHGAARSRAQAQHAAAWVQQLEAHRVDPQRHPAPSGAAPGVLNDVDRRLRALAAKLESYETAARAAKRLRVARALRADRSHVGGFFGMAALDAVLSAAAVPVPSTPEAQGEEPPPPDCGPYASELEGDVADARWSPMDSKANKLWHLPDQASLELGRRKSGKALTGTIRDAGVRRVFVRADNWHAGTYSFRSRVRFLSAHVSARVVIGYTRRDRGIQITLGGGDHAYATGRREKPSELRGIHIGVTDLRPFDTSASILSRRVAFRSPREVFTLTVHVDGPYMRVQVNDRDVLVHRRSTHDPIVGYVGFGLESGLIRFEDPETRHHRVLGADHACRCEPQDEPIRISRPISFPWRTCVGRRVVELPTNPGGTFLIWYSEETLAEERRHEYVESSIKAHVRRFESKKFPVKIRLVLPPPPGKGWEGGDFDRVKTYGLPKEQIHFHAGSPNLVALLEELAEKDAQAMHKGARELPIEEARERARERLLGGPTWLMLDEYGVVRACGPHGTLQQALALAHHLAGW